jgi:hypothetical protein
MNTFVSSDGTVFTYKPDLSEVKITISDRDIVNVRRRGNETAKSSQVTVSGPAMREFIAEHIRLILIQELPNLSIADVFRGLG